MANTESNVAAQQAFGEAVNTGDLARLDDLVDASCVDHDPAPGQGPGPDGFRAMFSELRTAFTDLHVEVEHLTANGDDVAFAYTITGTQNGPFMGHDATGKTIKVSRHADRPVRRRQARRTLEAAISSGC